MPGSKSFTGGCTCVSGGPRVAPHWRKKAATDRKRRPHPLPLSRKERGDSSDFRVPEGEGRISRELTCGELRLLPGVATALTSYRESSVPKPRIQARRASEWIGLFARQRGIVRIFVSRGVARSSWPCFFMGWKPMPQNSVQSRQRGPLACASGLYPVIHSLALRACMWSSRKEPSPPAPLPEGEGRWQPIGSWQARIGS